MTADLIEWAADPKPVQRALRPTLSAPISWWGPVAEPKEPNLVQDTWNNIALAPDPSRGNSPHGDRHS